MRWLDLAVPVRMTRVALVAPAGSLHDVLVTVADTASMEIDHGNHGQRGQSQNLPRVNLLRLLRRLPRR